jgi:hypothetical protein
VLIFYPAAAFSHFNLPQFYWWFKGDFKKFYKYNYEKYGEIYEIHFNGRFIILCQAEYSEKLRQKFTCDNIYLQ